MSVGLREHIAGIVRSADGQRSPPAKGKLALVRGDYRWFKGRRVSVEGDLMVRHSSTETHAHFLVPRFACLSTQVSCRSGKSLLFVHIWLKCPRWSDIICVWWGI